MPAFQSPSRAGLAIWYRHWLELRRPLLVLLAVSLVAAYFFSGNVVELLARVESRGTLPGAGRRWLELQPAYPARDLAVALGHFDSMSMLGLLAVIVLSGAGLTGGAGSRSWDGRLSEGAAAFTLLLPISRARLVLTRIGAAWLAVLLTLGAATAANAAALAWIGAPVPAGVLLVASGWGLLITTFWIAMASALTLIVGHGWALALVVAGWIVTSLMSASLMGHVFAGPRVVLEVLPFYAVLVAGALYLCCAVVADYEP